MPPKIRRQKNDLEFNLNNKNEGDDDTIVILILGHIKNKNSYKIKFDAANCNISDIADMAGGLNVNIGGSNENNYYVKIRTPDNKIIRLGYKEWHKPLPQSIIPIKPKTIFTFVGSGI